MNIWWFVRVTLVDDFDFFAPNSRPSATTWWNSHYLILYFIGPSDIKCGFDAHLCSFTQDTSDETDWVRGKGITPKPLTGPSIDHTTGSGITHLLNVILC